MSDGREEREEEQKRREIEERECRRLREQLIDEDYDDQWGPERDDS